MCATHRVCVYVYRPRSCDSNLTDCKLTFRETDELIRDLRVWGYREAVRGREVKERESDDSLVATKLYVPASSCIVAMTVTSCLFPLTADEAKLSEWIKRSEEERESDPLQHPTKRAREGKREAKVIKQETS